MLEIRVPGRPENSESMVPTAMPQAYFSFCFCAAGMTFLLTNSKAFQLCSEHSKKEYCEHASVES